MYKKLVQMLIDANTGQEINRAGSEIDKAFEKEKITWKDHEQLYSLLSKISSFIETA